MTNLDLNHRILSVQDDPGGQWPYGTAPERIQFLAHARNMALEPLQSPDNSIRIPNWQEYTKVIFLNDIVFRWQDIVNLIATRVEGEEEGYDMACAMDYGSSGMSVCRLGGKHPDIRSVRHMGCSGYLRRTATRLLALCLRQNYPERSPKGAAIRSSSLLERCSGD